VKRVNKDLRDPMVLMVLWDHLVREAQEVQWVIQVQRVCLVLLGAQDLKDQRGPLEHLGGKESLELEDQGVILVLMVLQVNQGLRAYQVIRDLKDSEANKEILVYKAPMAHLEKRGKLVRQALKVLQARRETWDLRV